MDEPTMAANRQGLMTAGQAAALQEMGAGFAKSASLADRTLAALPVGEWRRLADAIARDVQERRVVAATAEIGLVEATEFPRLPELRARCGGESAYVLAGHVLPGTFPVYRAAHSGVVVGFDAELHAAQHAYQHTWLAAHGVRPEALADNRAGRLSAEQRTALARAASGHTSSSRVNAVLSLVALAWLAVRIGRFIASGAPPSLEWLGWTAFLALAFLGAAWVAVELHRDAARKRRAAIEVHVGPLGKGVHVPRRGRVQTYVVVDGTKVEVPHALNGALVPGLRYRLYAVHDHFLSIELAPAGS